MGGMFNGEIPSQIKVAYSDRFVYDCNGVPLCVGDWVLCAGLEDGENNWSFLHRPETAFFARAEGLYAPGLPGGFNADELIDSDSYDAEARDLGLVVNRVFGSVEIGTYRRFAVLVRARDSLDRDCLFSVSSDSVMWYPRPPGFNHDFVRVLCDGLRMRWFRNVGDEFWIEVRNNFWSKFVDSPCKSLSSVSRRSIKGSDGLFGPALPRAVGEIIQRYGWVLSRWFGGVPPCPPYMKREAAVSSPPSVSVCSPSVSTSPSSPSPQSSSAETFSVSPELLSAVRSVRASDVLVRGPDREPFKSHPELWAHVCLNARIADDALESGDYRTALAAASENSTLLGLNNPKLILERNARDSDAEESMFAAIESRRSDTVRLSSRVSSGDCVRGLEDLD